MRLLASVTTCRRSSGRKAPGAAGARSVLEAGQSLFDVAFPPLANRVAITTGLIGDLLIGELLGLSRAEHNAAPQNEGLWSRVGANETFQRLTLLGGKRERRSVRSRHRLHPCGPGLNDHAHNAKMPRRCPDQLARDFRNGHLAYLDHPAVAQVDLLKEFADQNYPRSNASGRAAVGADVVGLEAQSIGLILTE